MSKFQRYRRPVNYQDQDNPVTKRETKIKNKTNGLAKKFYHATRVLFKPGDLIIPGHDPNFQSSATGVIYMTTSPTPHYTVAKKALIENWYVYEVQPTGKVHFQSVWDDCWSDRPAIVTKRIGSARGIAQLGRKKLSSEEKDWLKQMIQRCKDAIGDPQKEIEFDSIYGKLPSEALKEYQNNLQWGNFNTSKVNSNIWKNTMTIKRQLK